MIKLKNKINKSATLRELRKEAEKGYKHSWQPELQVEAFMKGAEALLNLLHLPRVSQQSELLSDFEKWLDKKENESYCSLPTQYVVDKYKSLNCG